MKISVVVLTYNSAATIQDCLQSVLDTKPNEIIVVDNASSDETVAKLKDFKGIKIIASPKNLGYNGGNQKGIELSSGDIVVILNPDAVIPKDFCSQITVMVKKYPHAGILGCGIKNPDGSVEITASKFPTFRSLLYEFSAYQKFFPYSKSYRDYLMLDWDRKSARIVDAVSGACTILTRPFINKIGQLDQGYFLYYEELDLAQSAKKYGIEVVYDPMVYITHLKAASTKQVGKEKINRIFQQSRNYYIRKYHGWLYLAAFKSTAKLFDLAWKIRRKLPIGYNS